MIQENPSNRPSGAAISVPIANPLRIHCRLTPASRISHPSHSRLKNVTMNWIGDGNSTESIRTEQKCQIAKNPRNDRM